MNKQHKQFQMKVNGLQEDGSFSGILSPYGNVDLGGDAVEPGAFTKTLKENGNTVPLLWQHQTTNPIGQLELEDGPDGLHCKGQLLLDLPDAQKAYLLLKARIVKGLSIGYDSVKSQMVDGVRRLKEIRLWEGSLVTFPMNEYSLVSSVKSLKGDFTEELTERQIQDAGCQMRYALCDALCSIPYSDLSRDDMMAMGETIITQFHDAYMAYIPDMLDMMGEVYGMDTKQWKVGRTLSASTKTQLTTMHSHMKSATEMMSALLAEEAGDTTSDPVAAKQHTTEPDEFHSAALILTSMRSLLTAA